MMAEPAMTATEMLDRMLEVHGEPAFRYTAARHLAGILEGRRFGHVVEIGTQMGLSAAVWAYFADTVTTIDILKYRIRDSVLETAGVTDRVVPVVVCTDAQKAHVISRLTFDMAFVDGDHRKLETDGVVFCPAQLDFDLVRRCGSVLFHDYPHSNPDAPAASGGAGYVLDTIGPKGSVELFDPSFAWWRAE